MVPIGTLPILWHIIEIFRRQGFCDQIIALGYKPEVIKRWLLDLVDLDGDMKFNFSTEGHTVSRNQNGNVLDLKIEAFNTGLNTQTGERLRKCVKKYPSETFIVTYGDGLANLNLNELVSFHKNHGKHVTVTGVRPPARFGGLVLEGNLVSNFGEKTQSDSGWINGGFIVCDSQLLSYYSGDNESLEFDILPRVVQSHNLMAFLHNGFWQPMDTLREKNLLAELASEPVPPWFSLQN